MADTRKIQGLEHMSIDEIKDTIMSQIEERMIECDVLDEEVSLGRLEINGSRGRGTAYDDSDLDAILEYSGTMREDDFFNVLHDSDFEPISVNGIEVDVNPVRKEESGDFEKVLAKSGDYDKQILSKSN